MRVLIIDDDPDLRNLLVQYIRHQWPAGDIAEYDPLERDLPGPEFPLQAYDVIILDYMLGRGDGLRWLEELRKRPKCSPIIFLTGGGSEIIAVRVMKLGVVDYQRKQELTRERLITAIRDVSHGRVEKTVTPDIAARMEGHVLGASLKIPGIKILRLIGEGGMSRVYLASRESDDEPLVVKILRSEVMQDKRTMARFVEEYNLVERVQNRHVARVHAHGVLDNHAYLVMEFCEGGDLNKRLGDKAMPPDEALRIFRQLMLALGDIHEQGILHRDLKPQNLMFRTDGSLAIVDFGVAKHVDSVDRTNKGEILGTPRYMSPEQVQGRALDLRTDIYSAGVLLYQMMLGQHLFEGETAVEVALHHLNTPPPSLPERLSAYQRLFDKLLEKDRDARFRNADEVIGYLTRKFGPAA